MTEPVPERNWLRILSPCILCAVFSVVAILISMLQLKSSQGWSLLGVIIYLPFLLILLTIDIVLKVVIKVNTLLLWLIEISLIVFVIILFLNRWN